MIAAAQKGTALAIFRQWRRGRAARAGAGWNGSFRAVPRACKRKLRGWRFGFSPRCAGANGEPPGSQARIRCTLRPPANGAVDEVLRRELSLAAEHVHSIRWLLEIAREHQQPIPSAALKNLELVSKHLYEMGRRIDGGGDAVMEPEVSAAARRPPPGLPPRPPRLSFECRTSPSDRSTPSG